MKNNLKKIQLILITIFILTLGCSAAEKSDVKASEVKSVKTELKKEYSADKLIVYYFHTEYRCWSCNQFETLTKEVLEESYRDPLKKKRVEFRLINVETNENKHFIEDYKLVTKSIILSLQKENMQIEWKNMDKIWMLVKNTEKFKSYIKEGIATYLEKVDQS